MAGTWLECGDCKDQLKGMGEAQRHAKLTGHSNFQESMATTTSSESATNGGGSAENSAAAEGGLAVPEVNGALLEELEGMGFSKARAVRALHFSGTESIEGAVNWIVEHEEDPDIDEMPRVAPAPALTPEEAKAKAQELVERARKKKEEEERVMEREREKERIRSGKELQMARRLEEDAERKRLQMFRKIEKDEERVARERIRAKLEEDKAERRRKVGLPPEEPSNSTPPQPAVEEKRKSYVAMRPAEKADLLRDALRSIKQAHRDDDARVKRTFQTLLTYVGNIARSPDEEKFRKIRLTNPTFQERVGNMGGVKFLLLCGFEEDQAGEFVVMPRERVDAVLLQTAGFEINSAIVNPFFGVL